MNTSIDFPTNLQMVRPWKGLGAGDLSMYAFTDSEAFAWGGNGERQLGLGADTAGKNTPTKMAFPSDVVLIEQLDGGFRHGCAMVRTNQGITTVYCFGSNTHGKLGQGTASGMSGVPTAVMDGGSVLEVSRIAVGWEHTCAVRKNNKEIVCWGLNHKGQLGDGTEASRPSPVRVLFP